MSLFKRMVNLICSPKEQYITEHHFVKSVGIKNSAFMAKATKNIIKADMTELIGKVSVEENVDRHLIQSICEQESGLIPIAIRCEPDIRKMEWYQNTCRQYDRNPEKIINTSSCGLMQILFVNCLKWAHETDTPYSICGSPKRGLKYGIWHFKELLDRFGEIEKAISAYNAGHPTSVNYESYVKPIMERYKDAK